MDSNKQNCENETKESLKGFGGKKGWQTVLKCILNFSSNH